MTDSKKNTTEPSLLAKPLEFEFSIEWTKAESAYKKALTKLAPRVKVPGFRKGKVPASVAEQHINTGAVIEEALQAVVPEAFQAALKEKNLQPVGNPEFSIVSTEMSQDWKLKVQISEKPEIKLDGYEKMVKTGVKAGQEALVEAKKAKKEADNDKKDEEATAQPSEEEQKRMDDDVILQHIYKELVLGIKPQVSELLVKQDVQQEIHNLTHQLEQYKLNLDEYLKERNITYPDFANQIASQSLSKFQLTFILDAIAQKAGIAVTEADIDAHIDTLETEAKLKEHYRKQDEYRRWAEQTLYTQKMTAYLLSV